MSLTHSVLSAYVADGLTEVTYVGDSLYEAKIKEEDFDRWLNRIKAEVWEEAASCAPEYMPANPYKEN